MRGFAQGKGRGKRGFSGRAASAGRVFLEMLADSYRQSSDLDLGLVAGSLAFTTVLSIVPFLAVLFYLAERLGGLNYAYRRIMPFLLDNLSAGAGELAEQYLSAFLYQVHAKAIGWAGFAGLIVTSLLAYTRIVKSLNVIWEVGRNKGVHHHFVRALVLMIVGPVLLGASIALSTVLAREFDWIPFSGPLIAFALIWILYVMIYGLVPLASVPAKPIVLGSLLPAALWEAAKYLYAIYTRKAVSYSAFYGSFAAVPLFLLWIYIAWYITLFGGAWVHTLQVYLRRRNDMEAS